MSKLFDRLEEWCMMLMLCLMTGVTFTQVVLRYVFGNGLTWALEFSVICFAFMIFLGISYGVRVGGHIGVDAFVKLFSSRVQRYLGLLAVLFSLLYVGMVLYGSWQYVSTMKLIAVEFDDLPIERWKVLAVMPIGYSLIAYRFLHIFWRLLTGKAQHLHLADEAAEALSSQQLQQGTKS